MIIAIPNGVTITVGNATEVARVLEALGLREPPQFVINPDVTDTAPPYVTCPTLVTARKVVVP